MTSHQSNFFKGKCVLIVLRVLVVGGCLWFSLRPMNSNSDLWMQRFLTWFWFIQFQCKEPQNSKSLPTSSRNNKIRKKVVLARFPIGLCQGWFRLTQVGRLWLGPFWKPCSMRLNKHFNMYIIPCLYSHWYIDLVSVSMSPGRRYNAMHIKYNFFRVISLYKWEKALMMMIMVMIFLRSLYLFASSSDLIPLI